MKIIKILVTVLVLVCFNFSFAQYTDVINSNRPGLSRSAFSVGTKVLQFELGPYFVKEKRTPAPRNEVSGFGADFAIRYGLLLEQLEINLEGSYQNDTRTNFSSFTTKEKRSNFRTLAFGAKYLLYDPYKKAAEEKPNLISWKANHSFKWKSLIPAVSVYLGANYDSKDNPFTAAGVEGISPRVIVATQHNFNGGWVFVMNFIKERIGSNQSDFSYILTLTHALNEDWVIFGETQGIQSDFYADNLIRFGGAYLWNENFQLDTALTFNTKDTPSVFSVNLGASYRLDFHKDKEIKPEDIDNGESAKDEKKRKKNEENPKREKRKKRKKEDDTEEEEDITPKKQQREDEDFDN
jgi:hypothetical protein